MRNANEYDEMLAELARLNPVTDEELVGVVPEPGHDSVPSLIMLDNEAVAGRTSVGRAGRRWGSGVLQGGLVARGVFVGAVASVCLVIVGLNLLLSDRVGDREQDGFDAAASTSLSRSTEVDDDASAGESETPGLPVGSGTPTTSDVVESQPSTGPEPSASAQPSTSLETETTLVEEPAAATDTTQPSTSSNQPTAPTSAPVEPCIVVRPTLTEAVVAYREHCTETREDCDPVEDKTAWICSSEIIGAEGPSATWG